MLLLTAVLQALCVAGVISPTTLPPPTHMFASLWTVLRSGDYSAAIWLTLRDIVLASAIAIAAGFVLGVTFHAQRFLRRGIEPFLASYYAVPTFIFYPVLIVVMGAGRAPVIAIAVALAIVAMITATLTGLDRIPPVLVKTARVMQLSPLQVMLQMQRPAVMPYLFTGIKLAVSYAVIGVIASEFILSGDGIGYAIAYAYNSFDNDTMYGLILFVVLVVSGLNSVLDIVDRRLQARLVD